MVTSPIPTPISRAAAGNRIAHAHSLSRSPGTDNDDVFSNPDTDPDGDARSDLTGATSPGPNSPDPGSPTRRGLIPSPLVPPHLKADHTTTSTHSAASDADSSAATLTKARVGRPSHSHATHAVSPSVSSSNPRDPALHSPLSSSPTSSRFITLLPSAHGLPSDPREASTLAQLFPQHAAAPSGASAGTAGASESHSVLLPSDLNSPDEERATFFGARWSRPSSPDYAPMIQSSSRRPSLHPALAVAPAETSESPQIFERDIEHRDAAHLLSHQEAMDVAIPSVLDDAAEAIVEGDEAQLEIVAPHVTNPLPLSARALGALSDASNSSPPASQSPVPGMSPGGLMEAPPGSIAAQLAEKLGGASVTRSHAHQDDGVRTAGTSTSTGAGALGHRRPHSDVSSASSFRSRSPGDRPGPGVQQVLDGSPTRAYAGGSPSPVSRAGRSSSPTANLFSSAGLDGFGSVQGSSSMHASIHSQHAPGSSATGSPLPSLPMPNPYRNASPSPAQATLPFASTPAPLLPASSGLPLPEDRPMASSLSIDGAVISRGEVATRGGSLAGIADALALDPSHAGAAPASSAGASPYLARTAAPSSAEIADGEAGMPGAWGAGAAGSASTVAGGVKDKRRLSFFSYADIINQTPADVLDFDGAVRAAASGDAGASSASMGRSMSSSAAMTPSATGAGLGFHGGSPLGLTGVAANTGRHTSGTTSPLGRTVAARRGSSGVPHSGGLPPSSLATDLEKESLNKRLEKLQMHSKAQAGREDVFGPDEGDNF